MLHGILILLTCLLVSSPPPVVAEQLGAKIRIFLCDTEDAALAFAFARTSAGNTSDDLAADAVNKVEKRGACNRYIGYVGKEAEHRRIVQGFLFKVTQYRVHFTDHRGERNAWSAERLFDADPKGAIRDL